MALFCVRRGMWLQNLWGGLRFQWSVVSWLATAMEEVKKQMYSEVKRQANEACSEPESTLEWLFLTGDNKNRDIKIKIVKCI